MHDLIVLGGGPAGYLGAERAAHAGMDTVLIEEREVGGVCLNEGCIPSKALLNSAKIFESVAHGKAFGVIAPDARLDHSLVQRRRAKVVRTLVAGVKMQLKGAGAATVSARGEIVGRVPGGFAVKAGDAVYEAKNLLIATGSSPAVPPIPGVKEGLESGFVITNREILEKKEVPERLVVIGGGVIGLEMAAYYNAAGSRVTVIEMLDHIAGPTDREISDMLRRIYEGKGVAFKLNAKVTGVENGAVHYETESGAHAEGADSVLLSIGRRANISGFGLEKLGVAVDRGGIVIDAQCRTNVPGVYAAGDVSGKYMLAHTAYREAEVAVRTMLGKKDTMRYHANPSVIYTYPEVAGVGHTEESAAQAGIPFETAKLPLRYAGRFVAESDGDGICKVLVDKLHRNVIGVHMLGSYASEIIWGAAQMIETELRVSDAREIIFPHPTVSEIIREVLFTFDDPL